MSPSCHFQITRTVAVNTAEEDIVSYNELYRLLDPVRTGQTRSIFLFVTREYSEHIIDVATRMGLFDKEWAWVFSEQCLGAKNLPQGILSVRLTHPEESHHVDDAANVATQGILNLLRREPDAMLNVQSVKSCDQNLDVSELHGNALRDPSLAWFVSLPKLYKTMISVTLEDGQTGHVQFDSQGDRVGSVYDIVNAQLPGGNQAHCHTRPCSPSLVPVGTYGFSQVSPKLDDPRTPGVKTAQLSIDVARIHWPGHYRLTAVRKICLKRGQRGECANHVEREVPVAPPSFKRKTHLKVRPFGFPSVDAVLLHISPNSFTASSFSFAPNCFKLYPAGTVCSVSLQPARAFLMTTRFYAISRDASCVLLQQVISSRRECTVSIATLHGDPFPSSEVWAGKVESPASKRDLDARRHAPTCIAWVRAAR
ncbi:unnamed protein product [Schistocephalus solidus]|uniref:Receptor ligand binding region domain-containing protein n=1 Tax=Schistocephalus solidus TaxID=70667 RepID=A0A3P7DZ83_SCHSO|nr:unnamed protein product [Schistocephalus solidus]